jgi:hypothetical protein
MTYRVLGQTISTANTLTTLYTVPTAVSAVCSTLVACNQGVSTNIRIAIRPAGATIDPKHYVVFDAYVNQGDTLWLTVGFTLATTDIVSVLAGTANVSFNLYGSEA